MTERFERNISGSIGCFDRLIFYGTYRPIQYPKAMGYHIYSEGIKLLDYEKEFANKLRLQMTGRIKEIAARENMEIHHVGRNIRKESFVSDILKRRGEQDGVVCILSAMEGCSCFKVRKNHRTGYLELQWSKGKCLNYYVYIMDPDYGLCHLRIPTWAPFRLQFYINQHNWLERRMVAEGINFKKADNCFTMISDVEKAQSFVDHFDVKALHQRLDQLASRFVAVHQRWRGGLYWSIAQAEWATDIMFKSTQILPWLYDELVRTAIVELKCSDVYGFLGKRLTEKSARDVSKNFKALREGTRIKHTIGPTSIKMYDKQDRVLRIETTTNDISHFKHRREVKHRNGIREMKHAAMRKTLYSLGALAEKMKACNKRYLASISQWRDHSHERTDLQKVTRSVKDNKERSYRGVNFFHEDDLAFMIAIAQPENCVSGFSNRMLRRKLASWSSQKIGRMLRRFKILKIIKRAGNTYKYYLAKLGEKVIAATLQIKERILLPAMATA